MEGLKVASIYLDGVNFFMALFIFLMICIAIMILGFSCHITSKKLDQLEMLYKQLHKKYQTACKERDDFSEKFYVADFQLDMANRELHELRQPQQGGECSLDDENTEETTDV